MPRNPLPKELQKEETVSIRVRKEDNLRLSVAVYLEGTNKSELLNRHIKEFNAQVEKKNPKEFAEVMKLFKKFGEKKGTKGKADEGRT